MSDASFEGKLALRNNGGASGADVTDVQQKINDNTSAISANTSAIAANTTSIGAKADSSTVTALTTTVSGKLDKTSNLSDLANAATARTNLSLGNVDNTSDATKNAAAVQLTNKDIDGGTATNARRITLPKATKATLDALTRKEGTVVYATDDKKAYIDDGSNLVAVGSGSGGGVASLIPKGDAETDATGWTSYNDQILVPNQNTTVFPATDYISYSAIYYDIQNWTPIWFASTGSLPGGLSAATKYYARDCVAGSQSFKVASTIGGAAIDITSTGGVNAMTIYVGLPNFGSTGVIANTITWTRDTTNKLTGVASYKLTKPAANCAGEGERTDQIAVPESYRGRVVQLTLTSKVLSGTYADGDVTLYWLDETVGAAPVLVRFMEGESLLNASGSQDVYARFQMPSTCTLGRFLIHISSASTSAYTIAFDDIALTKQLVSKGPAVSDWTDVALTSSWTTNTTVVGRCRRIGDSAQIQFDIRLSGAPNNTDLRVYLPASLPIDYTKLIGQNYASVFGSANAYGPSGGGIAMQVFSIGANGFWVTYQSSVSNAAESLLSSTAPVTWASGHNISGTLQVPILGWSSNQVLSSDQSGRRVLSRYYASANQALTSGQVWNFDAKLDDITGSVTTGASWKFVASDSDYYRVSLTGLASTSGSTVFIWKNGAVVNDGVLTSIDTTRFSTGTSVIYLKASEYIDVRPNSSITMMGSTGCVLTIEKAISGSQQIAVSEKVRAVASTAAGQTVPTSFANVVFGTITENTHGCLDATGTTFTANRNGTLKVQAAAMSGGTNIPAGSAFAIALFKNGTLVKRIGATRPTAAGPFNYIGGPASTSCVIGDQFNVRVICDNANALYTSSSDNWVEWEIA